MTYNRSPDAAKIAFVRPMIVPELTITGAPPRLPDSQMPLLSERISPELLIEAPTVMLELIRTPALDP